MVAQWIWCVQRQRRITIPELKEPQNPQVKKLLALNRSEIAIRIMRAATELGLRTVAIYSKEDRLSLHRFKADEAYQIGDGMGPVQAYLDVDGIVAMAKQKGVDAIHPGYGFLSENPALPGACGSDALFLVRYIRQARHVEVQILGDGHGNLLHLHERDCSVQRRHQKVVEVAPAVGLADSIRRELADAAIRLAKAAGYYSA